MSCIAFLVCLLVLIRRRRNGQTIAMPAFVMALGLVRLVLLAVTTGLLVAAFKAVAHESPQNRARVLERHVHDAMRPSKFGLCWEIPLLAGAWLFDRRLRRLESARLPPAARAPDGATCGVHPEVTASHVCSRCGAFVCVECLADDGCRCRACEARAAG